MSISEYSIRNRSIVWFVLALFVAGGIWAFSAMGKKEDSTFVLKSAVVTCDYAGATPEEVERLITEPVSRELQSMRGVHKITSESYYGFSKIMVELDPGTRAREIPQLWDELRRKVMNIGPQLPTGAGAIRVNDDFSDVYGLYYGLAADEGFSWSEIRDVAQRIKTAVVTIDGVQKVAVFAEQTPVINLYITRSTLANLAITPEAIVSMISQQNSVVNSGEITAGDMQVRILETGVYNTIDDIADQLLIAADGKQYRLGDVVILHRGALDELALVVELAEKVRSRHAVRGRRGARIYVERDAQTAERILDYLVVTVDHRLRRHALLAGLDGDGHAVLVAAAHRHHVAAAHAQVTRVDVRRNVNARQMAYMHGTVGIGQSRSNEVSFELFCHK